MIHSLATVVLILSLSGCRSTPAPPPVSPRALSSQVPDVNSPSDTGQSLTPVRDSITELIKRDAEGDHVFPANVKVNRVTIDKGVASIDFSAEFSQLANSGESVESAAQKCLRNTLSQFKTIEKMRVTVDGKPFDSQATDWFTPFTVRGAGKVETSRPSNHREDSASR